MATTRSKPTPEQSAEPVNLESIKHDLGIQPEPEEKRPTPIGDVNVPLVGKPQLYPAPSGPSYPRVETEVTIRVPPYEGFTFRCWKNAKMRIHDSLYAPDADIRMAAFHQLFLSHNGWCDDNGDPLPPMSDTLEFVKECPTDLFFTLREAYREEAQRVPDFPTRGS